MACLNWNPVCSHGPPSVVSVPGRFRSNPDMPTHKRYTKGTYQIHVHVSPSSTIPSLCTSPHHCVYVLILQFRLIFFSVAFSVDLSIFFLPFYFVSLCTIRRSPAHYLAWPNYQEQGSGHLDTLARICSFGFLNSKRLVKSHFLLILLFKLAGWPAWRWRFLQWFRALEKELFEDRWLHQAIPFDVVSITNKYEPMSVCTVTT